MTGLCAHRHPARPRPPCGLVDSARDGRRGTFGVALLVLACAFLFAGTRSVWEPDEGRYAAVALEMLHTGDWWHPALNPEHPHYTKPPLTYWCIAGSVALLGESEWALRLPSALAFALSATMTGAIAFRLSPGRGRAATAIFATSALAAIAANIATTDMVLAMMETAAMLAFVRAWRRLDAEPSGGFRRGSVRWMWLAFGLAFMTKGPPGLLPLLAIMPIAVRAGGWRALRELLDPVGVVLGLLVGLAWFVAIVVARPELASYFVGEEVVGRIATGLHGRHSEWTMALLYPPLVFAGMLPWSLSWSPRRVREGLRGIGCDPVRLLLLLWIAAPLAVFMASSSRMPLYVLPLVAPLAVASARIQPVDWLAQPATWRFLAGCVAAIAGARGVAGHVASPKDARSFSDHLALSSPVESLVFVDTRAWWGASFYLGATVRESTLDPDRATPWILELPALLERRTMHAIALVMPPERRSSVERILADADRPIRSRSTVDGRLVIEAGARSESVD